MHRVLPRLDELPMALYRADQVRELDRVAIHEYEIPGHVLMRRAGMAAYQLMRERWPDMNNICVVTGTGNNAGDGFVLANEALKDGLEVVVRQVGDRDALKGDAKFMAGH